MSDKWVTTQFPLNYCQTAFWRVSCCLAQVSVSSPPCEKTDPSKAGSLLTVGNTNSHFPRRARGFGEERCRLCHLLTLGLIFILHFQLIRTLCAEVIQEMMQCRNQEWQKGKWNVLARAQPCRQALYFLETKISTYIVVWVLFVWFCCCIFSLSVCLFYGFFQLSIGFGAQRNQCTTAYEFCPPSLILLLNKGLGCAQALFWRQDFSRNAWLEAGAQLGPAELHYFHAHLQVLCLMLFFLLPAAAATEMPPQFLMVRVKLVLECMTVGVGCEYAAGFDPKKVEKICSFGLTAWGCI